jgi:hypothetical protein
MRKIVAILVVGALMLGTLGCGGGSDKTNVKVGDTATKNTGDPPDTTKMPKKHR